MADLRQTIHAKYADWRERTRARGEYRDFTRFDLEGASRAGMGPVQFEVLGPIPQSVSLVRLSELREAERAELAPRLLQAPDFAPGAAQDKLLAWHGAHLQDGWVLRVPERVDAGFLHLRTRAGGHSALHHLLLLGAGARASVLLEMEGEAGRSGRGGEWIEAGLAGADGTKTEGARAEVQKAGERGQPRIDGRSAKSICLHTNGSEARLEEGAELALATVQRYDPRDWAVSHHDQRLERFAKLTHTAASFGAEVSRSRACNRIVGAHAQAQAYQLFIAQGRQFMDLETFTHHQTASGRGEMTCRGALDGSAEGLYQGRIRIDPSGSDTISHQSGSAIMLSEDCSARIVPCLEVNNDQVEAGHGASVGSLDEQELLYLRSRGLSQAQARRLVMEGYFQALIARVPGTPTQERLRALIAQYLPADSGPGANGRARSTRGAATPVIANPGLEARPGAHEGIKEGPC